jgi:hypothetical protein
MATLKSFWTLLWDKIWVSALESNFVGTLPGPCSPCIPAVSGILCGHPYWLMFEQMSSTEISNQGTFLFFDTARMYSQRK